MATAAAVHILVRTEKEAQLLLAQLKKAKGKNFAALARKFSICPSAKRGGDLGEFKRGQMVSSSTMWYLKKISSPSTAR